ncbi:penicillin acylase family protein, partial [Pseudomonas syringae group genomosp. 7]|uniref:penicillin acylase family protein n=1 Tax=Pseudomonas syringae group genomosp. 7 TaxID=251699 RepID=UPI003770526F
KATLDQRSYMASDLLFKWLNAPQALADFWKAHPLEIRQLMQGYVAGYNRSLAEQKTTGLPQPSAAEWVRPITPDDLV